MVYENQPLAIFYKSKLDLILNIITIDSHSLRVYN